VDRMDYLVRDSHFAGVALGRVDIYYLIHCLTIVEHDGNSLCSLGVEEKGVNTTWKVSCNLLNLRKQFTEGFFSAVFVSP
jgi:HD superfamily phosphohydrolase